MVLNNRKMRWLRILKPIVTTCQHSFLFIPNIYHTILKTPSLINDNDIFFLLFLVNITFEISDGFRWLATKTNNYYFLVVDLDLYDVSPFSFPHNLSIPPFLYLVWFNYLPTNHRYLFFVNHRMNKTTKLMNQSFLPILPYHASSLIYPIYPWPLFLTYKPLSIQFYLNKLPSI